MKKIPPIAIHLAWFTVAGVAFIVGTNFQNGEATRRNANQSATSMLDAPTGSFVEASSGASMERNPAMRGGRVGISRAAAASEETARRIGSTLDGILNTQAATKEQLVLYVEECKDLIKGLKVENARAIAEIMEKKNNASADNEEIETLYKEFYLAWGALAGADAIAFNDEVGGDAQIEIVEAWAKTDLEAAKTYAVEQRKLGAAGILSQSMLQRILVERLAETNIDDAIAYSMTNELESAASGYSGAEILAKKIYAQRGLAGIESWLSLVEKSCGPDEARYYRNAVAEFGLGTIGEANPVQAREWLVKQAARGVINAGSMNRIMSDNKLTTGPEDALSLIAMARPADPKDAGSYSQLVAEKFGDYLERDFNAAGAWLAAQPRDSRNDGAIQKFALEAARSNRETALLWVEQISDEQLREATLAKPEFTGNATVARPR